MKPKCRKNEAKILRTRLGRVWYKTTRRDGTPLYGHYKFRYNLPRGKRPGKWHVHEGCLSMCHSGFHVTQTPKHWQILGMRLFKVEATGFDKPYIPWYVKHRKPEVKSVCRSIRFVKEIRRGSKTWKKLMRRG